MSRHSSPSVSRRSVLVTTGLLGASALSATAAANPPKGVEPIGTDPQNVVRKIDGMLRTIGTIQDRLESREGAVLETVYEHTFLRVFLATEARDDASDRAWTEARASLAEVKGIVEGDIDLLEGVEDRASVEGVLGLERALLAQTVSTLGVMPGDNVS